MWYQLFRFLISIRAWFCEDCNHDRHLCGGCGTIVGHGDGRTCEDCKVRYAEEDGHSLHYADLVPDPIRYPEDEGYDEGSGWTDREHVAWAHNQTGIISCD